MLQLQSLLLLLPVTSPVLHLQSLLLLLSSPSTVLMYVNDISEHFSFLKWVMMGIKRCVILSRIQKRPHSSVIKMPLKEVFHKKLVFLQKYVRVGTKFLGIFTFLEITLQVLFVTELCWLFCNFLKLCIFYTNRATFYNFQNTFKKRVRIRNSQNFNTF